MTFRNVSSIKIPSLATVNGSMGFYGNYMDSIAAPNLTSVGSFATGVGSLAIVANAKLANISFPALKSVGGADQIANNTALHAIAFPALTSVAGAIDFSGNFTTPELPKLEDIKGGFNIQSQQAITCSGFEEQSGGKGSIIQGKFICKSATATTETLDGSASTTGGSSGSSATPKSDATNFGLSQAALGASFIGIILVAVRGACLRSGNLVCWLRLGLDYSHVFTTSSAGRSAQSTVCILADGQWMWSLRQ